MADELGKSVATISKYESGDLAIGIDALIDICRILNLSIETLLPDTSSNVPSDDFKRYEKIFEDKLYIYWYNGEQKRIGVAALSNDSISMNSILFFGLKDVSNIYECEYIYNGTILLSDTCIVYLYRNTDPPFDTLMMRLPVFSKKGRNRIGLMTTISSYYQSIALKVFVSETPVTDPESLMPNLIISQEELKDMKRSNFFTVL